jgi:virginiamycin B lyase
VIVVLLQLVLWVLAAAGPSTPTVSGPRSTERHRVTYRFHSHERGVPDARLGFRCAVDSGALRRCPSPYTVTLAVGRHTLRVVAVDPRGRRSRTATLRITILAPRAPEIEVGSAPLNVIAVGNTLWTENYGDGTVSVVEASSGSVRSIAVGGQPGGIAYGAGSVWVSDLGDGTLTRLDPAGGIVARIALGGQGAGVAVQNGVVYVADYSGGLTRVDAATNSVLGRTPLAGSPEAVAIGFGRVWVANGDGTVSTLDPATGAVQGAPLVVGADVDDVSIGSDAVWAVALYGQRLARIDPASRTIVSMYATAGQPSGVLATGGAVWLSYYDRDTVARFDPALGRVAKTYRVGMQPRSLVEAAGAIWVANQRSGSISRITP